MECAGSGSAALGLMLMRQSGGRPLPPAHQRLRLLRRVWLYGGYDWDGQAVGHRKLRWTRISATYVRPSADKTPTATPAVACRLWRHAAHSGPSERGPPAKNKG